jgi:hypothetical protein
MSRRTTDAAEPARARRRRGGRVHRIVATIWAFAYLVGPFPEAAAVQPTPILRPVATVLHAHSTWSSGALSLEDLIAQARGRNVEAVFLAENHLQRFEYGLPPLRTLLRHRVEYPSVLPKDPRAFLAAVHAANEKQRDVLIIPGVETIPHYFWTGNLLGGTLTMHNAQKNVLALGLYRAEDYQALPVVGNDGSARWGLGSLWLISPLLLVIGGLWLLRVKRRRVIRLRHFRVAEERRLIGPGVLCLVAGILLLANNYPFRPSGVSPYDAAAGLTPHQSVIDFVTAKGGVSVWSLPEARDHQVVTVAGLRATIRTDPYPEDLLRTDRFTAFGGVYEDTTTFTEPGQGWDQLLLEYLHSRRAAPAWAVGEAAFHFEGQAGKRFGDVQTVVMAARKDAAALLEGLRAGCAYALLRTPDEGLVLDRFQAISPDAPPAEAGSRLALRADARPEVHAVVGSASGNRLPVEVRLIRSGSVVQTFRGDTPLSLRWTDTSLAMGSKSYFRLDIRAAGGHRLLSNPVFLDVSREGRP